MCAVYYDILYLQIHVYSKDNADPTLQSIGVNALGFFDLPPIPLMKEVSVPEASWLGHCTPCTSLRNLVENTMYSPCVFSMEGL